MIHHLDKDSQEEAVKSAYNFAQHGMFTNIVTILELEPDVDTYSEIILLCSKIVSTETKSKPRNQ